MYCKSADFIIMNQKDPSQCCSVRFSFCEISTVVYDNRRTAAAKARFVTISQESSSANTSFQRALGTAFDLWQVRVYGSRVTRCIIQRLINNRLITG